MSDEQSPNGDIGEVSPNGDTEHELDFDKAFAELEEHLGDVKELGEHVLTELPMALDGRATPEDFIELDVNMHIPIGFVRQLEYALEHVKEHNCLTARRFLNSVIINLIGRMGQTAREAVEERGQEARDHAREKGWTPENGWPQEMIEEADRLEAESEAAIIQKMIDDGVIESADDVVLKHLDHEPGDDGSPKSREVFFARTRNIGKLWQKHGDMAAANDSDRDGRIVVVELGPNSGLNDEG